MGTLGRPPRIVMLASDGDSTWIAYNGLRKDLPIAKVILEDPISRWTLLKRRFRKLGARKVAGQLAFQFGMVPALRRTARRRIDQITRDLALDRTPADPSVIQRVPSANSPEAMAALRALAPDVVIVNGTRILSKEVLSCVQTTFLNTHAGVTPMYRGVHGGYWALAEQRPDLCGVTVHIVDTGIDTGSIVGQAMIRPTADDSFVTYPYLQMAAALPVLAQAVRDACNHALETKPPLAGSSKLWSHPTIGEYLRNRLAHGVK